MSDLLDWAEKAGMENLRFRLQNAETLAKEAGTTLTILLAGMGGALAYAIKGFEQPTPSTLAIGAAVLAAWLMAVGILLVVFCILTKPLQVPTNEPKNLYQKECRLEKLRELELENIQGRIEETTARNAAVAMWLDRVRLMALASPVVFAIVAWASGAR